MAFRWRADDGSTLNAGLVDVWFFKESGQVILLRNPIVLWFFRRVRPPAPPPPSESTHATDVCIAESWESYEVQPLVSTWCASSNSNKLYMKRSKIAHYNTICCALWSPKPWIEYIWSSPIDYKIAYFVYLCVLLLQYNSSIGRITNTLRPLAIVTPTVVMTVAICHIW